MTFGEPSERIPPLSRRATAAATGIVVFSLVIYLCFLTQNYYWDGISFSQTIEDADRLQGSLLHPNHLIYNVVGFWLYKAVLALGIDVRAVLVLQVANAFFSAAAAAVLFFILNRLFRSVSLAAVLTVLFSFSATWWRFSIDADPYISSVLFMLISFALILPDDKPKPLALALTHSLSMCFHQLAVFFFPVAILGLYFQTSSLSKTNRLSVFLKYGVVAFVITFGAYYFSYYLASGDMSVRGFSTWITYFSPDVGFTFKFADSFTHSLRGQVKLFFEGRFSFLREVMGFPIMLLLTVFTVAVTVLIYQIVRWFRNRPSADGPSNKRLFWLCAVWAAVYLIFLFSWLPHNTFYRLFYFPAFVILLGIFARRYQLMERQPWLARSFVVVLVISNFVFFVYPYSRVRAETPLSVALQLNGIWSRRTVVYFQKLDSDNMLIRYFNPEASWKQVEDFDLTALEAELNRDHHDGREAWADVSTFELIERTPAGRQWLDKHAISDSQVGVNGPTYKVRFIRLEP